MRRRLSRCGWVVLLVASLTAGIVCAQSAAGQNDSSPPITTAPTAKDYVASPTVVKLKIMITNPNGHPVGNASVYVRYPKPDSFLHHGDLQELDLKTNLDGSVKVPPVPQGKVEIQVIAKGWHTYGEWYDVEKDDQTVKIQLQEPPHWY
ncbi:MAG TPA: hypothetical protein VMB47_04840 [Candidatus Aquilonibacter sp.]|nr:hypothetical protein [Candidatus Aquilonibacter sp.]